MSQDNATTAEQVVEAKLKEATGYDVKFSELDSLNKSRLKMAYQAVERLIPELLGTELINNREDKRNPEKIENVLQGAKKLQRAVLYGICHGIEKSVTLPKFQTEEEAVTAGAIAQLMELTMLELAANMRKEENVINTNSIEVNSES